MEFLEKKILADGKVYPGDILKVDNFLNHQLDVDILSKIGEELFHLYKDSGVNKILTIEASGIAVAVMTAAHFHCPVVYAKKNRSSNLSDGVYTAVAHSYTHNNDNHIIVSKDYLHKEDKILIVDDFLANGCALKALLDICKQAGAIVIGAGIAIEKVYQGGGNELREQGIRIESIAKVASMTDTGLTFC